MRASRGGHKSPQACACGHAKLRGWQRSKPWRVGRHQGLLPSLGRRQRRRQPGRAPPAPPSRFPAACKRSSEPLGASRGACCGAHATHESARWQDACQARSSLVALCTCSPHQFHSLCSRRGLT